MILDTNALSAWVEGLATVEAAFRSADRLAAVPSVVLAVNIISAEIRQSRYRSRYEEWLRRYLPLAEIETAVTSATARCLREALEDIRLELKRLGHPIPPNDAWIACTRLLIGFAGVEQRHFDRGCRHPADRFLNPVSFERKTEKVGK